jgi:hypothetical protein
MASKNPRGPGAAVALKITADQVRFLRSVFRMAQDGIKDELANYPKQLGDPIRLRREEAAYGRLLTALGELVIVPDNDVRSILRDLAQMIDAANEHERVTSEHEALHSLLDQLTGGGSDVR